MATQPSARLSPQPHQQKKRGIFSRGLFIILLILCVLAILSFIGATIFWIGLVRDRLPDVLGAVFTASGTLFGFIALILAIPPFFQYLRERRASAFSASQPTNDNNHNDQSRPVSPPNLPQNNTSDIDGQNTNKQPSSPPSQAIQQNDGTAIDRNALKRILSECNTTIFEDVVFRLKPKGGILPSKSVPQGQRANELIDWAESDGPGLPAVYVAYLFESGKKKT